MKQLLTHAFLAPICLYLFFANASSFREEVTVKGDAYGYMTMALNLVHYGTLSKACEDFSLECPEEQRIPTYYREPVMSSILALAIRLWPATSQLSRKESFVAPGILHPELFSLMSRIGWLQVFVTASCCFGIMYLLTANSFFSYLVFYLVSTSPIMSQYTQVFLTENTASMLFAMLAFLLMLAFKTRKQKYFLLAGGCLGLLALTRAVFSYLWPAYMFVILLAWVFRKDWRPVLKKGGVLFLVAFYGTTAVWMSRNYYHFGDFAISQRGGRALTIRIFFNQMSHEELKASFFLWAPYKPAARYLSDNFAADAVKRFDRKNPEGFYRSARAYGANKLVELGDDARGERALKTEAIDIILKDPLKHLLVSASLGFRGMFVEADKQFGSFWSVQSFWLNIFLFSSLFSVFFWAILNRNYALLVVVLPAVFSFLFHASFSNCRTRYNQPILPALWLSGTLVFFAIWAALARLFNLCKRFACKYGMQRDAYPTAVDSGV